MKRPASYYNAMLKEAAKRRADIRRLAKTLKHREIANRFRISEARVSQIVNGK